MILLQLIDEFVDDVPTVLGTLLMNSDEIWQLLARYAINFLVVGIIIHFFYYPKSKNRDYYHSFMLLNISVFLLIFMMGDVKVKTGFALGIFAIFSIIRYRTESIPIREMTYLFLIIAISVINALSGQISFAGMMVTNAIFLCTTWLLENIKWVRSFQTKIIHYDRIDLITPDKREEMKADLEKRTGIKNIHRIEIGSIDFLKDTAFIRISYQSEQKFNAVNVIAVITTITQSDSTPISITSSKF